MNTTPLNELDAQQLREMVHSLMANVASKSAEIVFKQAMIDKLTHEMAGRFIRNWLNTRAS